MLKIRESLVNTFNDGICHYIGKIGVRPETGNMNAGDAGMKLAGIPVSEIAEGIEAELEQSATEHDEPQIYDNRG